jgi:hypothetical protein
MSGNTGKMTAEAIRQRGPRKVLMVVRGCKVIYRQDQCPIKTGGWLLRAVSLAKSYDTRYLLRVAKGNDL